MYFMYIYIYIYIYIKKKISIHTYICTRFGIEYYCDEVRRFKLLRNMYNKATYVLPTLIDVDYCPSFEAIHIKRFRVKHEYFRISIKLSVFRASPICMDW